MPPPTSARWIAFRKARPHATVRLVCLPFAGGGALAFRDWADDLPPTIDVCPVELPGRGTRFNEPCFESMSALVDALMGGLGPILAEPYALFGHSMGARVALEIARRAPRRPEHVFASGCPAPHLDREPLGHKSDAELVELLGTLGGTPREVLANRELLDLALPILRADLRVLDSHDGGPSPRIDAPLTALSGTKDTEIEPDEARAWGEYTTNVFRFLEIDGDHFFVTSSAGRKRVLEEIASTLRRDP